MKFGFADKFLFPNVLLAPEAIRLTEYPGGELRIVSNQPLSTRLASLKPDEVLAMKQAGFQLNIYRSIFGTLDYNYTQALELQTGTDNPHGGPGDLKTLTITAPEEGAVISGPSAGARVTIEGTASGPNVSRPNPRTVKVEVKVGSGPFAQAQPVAIRGGIQDWSRWSLAVTIPAAGPQVITAQATFSDGSTVSDDVDIVVTLLPASTTDTTPPTVTISIPSEGDTIQASPAGVQITITGTASDAGSGVRSVQCGVDGQSSLVPAIPKTAGDFSTWTAALLVGSAGRHRIFARAADAAGNVNQISVGIKTIVAPPRLMIVEIYRLSSFLGNYGAGRVVKTFSLLPGEKTKISVT
jgi:hypothetical protein